MHAPHPGQPSRPIDDLVEHGLDLRPFYDDYTKARGAPPCDPRLLLKLLIFGYSNGVTSSRELERRCHHDVAYMFLTAQAAPDFVVISWFRKRHGKAFAALPLPSRGSTVSKFDKWPRELRRVPAARFSC